MTTSLYPLVVDSPDLAPSSVPTVLPPLIERGRISWFVRTADGIAGAFESLHEAAAFAANRS